MCRLYELRYQSCGVGMPTEAEEGFRLDQGIFSLAMDRRFKNIPLVVSILEGHGIVVKGIYQPFRNWARPEETLVLKPRRGLVATFWR